jgi:colanic acid/amylovoran biosynthesis glycosyltransferase
MPLDEPMRLGYVVKRYPRYSETFIVREILAHEAAGVQIDIFALRPPSDTHFQDPIARVRAPVHYLPPEEHVSASDFWAAIEASAALMPDLWTRLEDAGGLEVRDVYQAVVLARHVRQRAITHLHAPFASDPATVAWLASRFARVPYSFTARAKDIFHKSVQPELLRRKLRDAAAVITVSNYNLDWLRKTYGAAASHVQRIYNGLDLGQFPYTVPSERPPRIVSVGRLVEKKGFRDLLDACAILAARGRTFTCHIIGTGLLEAELRAHSARLGLQKIVQLTGPRPQSEVIRDVRTAAVFALPCIVADDGDRDGLPNVLFEAMALGTPCVSTDVTGIPEVLHHGETGLMVPQHDPPSLAEAIDRLLTDPTLRIRLASAARRLIEAEFDVHRNAARRRALFRQAERVNIEAA